MFSIFLSMLNFKFVRVQLFYLNEAEATKLGKSTKKKTINYIYVCSITQ